MIAIDVFEICCTYLLMKHAHHFTKQLKATLCHVNVVAMKSLRKLNLNSTYLSALTFEGLKVDIVHCVV